MVFDFESNHDLCFWRFKVRMLELQTTSDFGQRHVCKACGTYLTIIYDGDHDEPWLSAGSFDDESLQKMAEKLRIINDLGT